MKCNIWFLTLCLFLVIQVHAENPGGNTSESGALSPPDIATLYLYPDFYDGQTIAMKGIVAASYPSDHSFILSDKTGCISCSAGRKESEVLKVYFSEKIPGRKEIVSVSGILTRGDDKVFSINATSVKW